MTSPMPLPIVVDASFTARILLPYAHTGALDVFDRWRQEHRPVFAPDLWLLESVSAVRQAFHHRLISAQAARVALDGLFALGVTVIPADQVLCAAAFEWAGRLGQSRAYDGFYLALAQRLGAENGQAVELWTADGRLANRVAQVGVGWVQAI